MKRTITQFFAFICALTISFSSFAQLSEGGTPYAFTHTALQTKTTLQKEVLFQPDLTFLAAQDAVNDIAKDSPYRVGINIPVNYNTNNSGNWETTADGGSLWRLRIESPDADALSLYFHNFFLPAGSKVFVYNEGENHVLGAFTDAYNFQNTIRATQMIEGDILTIEYYAPAGTNGSPVIEVKDVVYFYRGVEDFIQPIKDEANGVSNSLSEKAEDCQIDVACTPESTGHADIINSAVHYTFSTGTGTAVCSASMINNTSQDCTPYILTAWHCGEPNAGSSIATYVWYWNYQKASCATGAANGTDPSRGTDTMTGGTVVASSGSGTLNNPPGTNQLAGSDFFLVQLGTEPPVSYNAFYAGWDRNNTGATSGVGIHHPAGSAKKISTYTSTLTSSSYNGGAANTHWVVTWAATTNGHGVTEGGSSGSPIFNSSDRIVGQLSGGSSFCATPTSSDLYGKMYTNWDLCGTTANSQLQPWLDPTNTGAAFMDGAYQPCSSTNPPTCGINASTMNINVGGTVNFADASTGIPTSWAWNFDNTSLGGATPSASSVQNPGNVIFSNAGTYQVELTATNANGSCTSTVNIVVAASTGCDTLLNILDTNSLTIYSTTNGGFISGTNGYGDLAKAEKYTGYTPYTHVTGSDIFFYGVQDGGNGATVDLTIWNDNAGLPGTVVDVVSYSLASIETALAANSGQGLLYLAFNSPVNVAGNDFYIGVDMSSFGAGDTIGIVSKYASVITPVNSGYEQWSDGTWSDMESAWGGPFSMYITARVTDLPVSGSVSGPATGCANSAIALTATGVNSTDFDWFAPNGVLSNDSLANTTVTYAAAGTYRVYTYINGTCSGQYLDSLDIVVSNGPTVSSVGNDPSCAGGDGDIAITATGTGPFTYSIDGGATSQSGFNFPNLSSGTYNIVVTDGNGCDATDVITLAGTAGGATITIATVDPSCGATDGQITITTSGGSAPFTYSIDGGATSQAGAVFTGLAVGSYNIEVTDGGGCVSTGAATLSSAGGPSLTATGANLTCNGANDGTITATATGGTGTNTYSLDGTTYVSGNVFSGQAAGTYTVYVQDANGCQATSSVTITEPAPVLLTATGVDASCGMTNGSINATSTGGVGSVNYTLNGGTAQASGSFTGLAAGTYTVAVTDANGCTNSTTVLLAGTTSPVPTASVVNETCLNANGSISVSATGGQSPLQYSINGGMTYQSSAMFSALSAGTYAVMVQDAAGCTGTTNVSVTNTGGFNLNISNAQTICAGNSATITASGAGVGGSYVWDNGLAATATHTVSPTITTVYNVIATDAGGCSQTGTVTVTVESIPSVTVVPANPEICSGEAVTLIASGAQSYIWNNGTTAATLTVTPTSQTTYTVIGQNGSCSGAPVQTTVLVSAAPTVVASSDVFNIPVGGTVNFSNAGSSATGYTWTFGDGNTSAQGTVAHTYNVMGTYTATLTGSIANCTGTDVIIVNVGVVDVPQVDLEQAITVFPNPNNGQFNLKLDLNSAENVSIELFSSIGQIVASQTLGSVNNAILNFDLSNEAEGFYFVKVTTSTGTVTKTITLVK